MRVKERGYSQSNVPDVVVFDYSTFNSFDKKYVYPEFILFFSNVRYLVEIKYKNFKVFERAIFAGLGVKLSYHTVYGYEKGYFKTLQYNWMKKVAVFLGQSVFDMLSINLRERAEGLPAADPV